MKLITKYLGHLLNCFHNCCRALLALNLVLLIWFKLCKNPCIQHLTARTEELPDLAAS